MKTDILKYYRRGYEQGVEDAKRGFFEGLIKDGIQVATGFGLSGFANDAYAKGYEDGKEGSEFDPPEEEDEEMEQQEDDVDASTDDSAEKDEDSEDDRDEKPNGETETDEDGDSDTSDEDDDEEEADEDDSSDTSDGDDEETTDYDDDASDEDDDEEEADEDDSSDTSDEDDEEATDDDDDASGVENGEKEADDDADDGDEMIGISDIEAMRSYIASYTDADVSAGAADFPLFESITSALATPQNGGTEAAAVLTRFFFTAFFIDGWNKRDDDGYGVVVGDGYDGEPSIDDGTEIAEYLDIHFYGDSCAECGERFISSGYGEYLLVYLARSGVSPERCGAIARYFYAKAYHLGWHARNLS